MVPALRLPSVTVRRAAGFPPSYRCVAYERPTSYRWRAGVRVAYEPATIHEEMSPCVSALRTVQSAELPAGAPTEMYATPCDRLSNPKSCCGVSNEPVVRKLT